MKDSKALEALKNNLFDVSCGGSVITFDESYIKHLTYDENKEVAKKLYNFIRQALQQPTDSEVEEALKLVDGLIEYYIDSERTFMENSTLISGYDKWQKTVDDNVEKYKTIHKTLTKTVDIEVEEAITRFEEEFKNTCEELKSKGLSYMDAHTIIGNGLEYDWYEIIKPIIRKALTKEDKSAKPFFVVENEWGKQRFCPHCQEKGLATMLGGWENYCGYCGNPISKELEK